MQGELAAQISTYKITLFYQIIQQFARKGLMVATEKANRLFFT
jgi:hypothetical protein